MSYPPEDPISKAEHQHSWQLPTLSAMLVPSMGMGILQNPERYQVGTVPPAAPRGKCKTHLSTTANRKGVRGRGAEGQEEKSSQSSCRALHGAGGHGHGKQGWSQLAYGLCSAQCSAPAALPLLSRRCWAGTGVQGIKTEVHHAKEIASGSPDFAELGIERKPPKGKCRSQGHCFHGIIE